MSGPPPAQMAGIWRQAPNCCAKALTAPHCLTHRLASSVRCCGMQVGSTIIAQAAGVPTLPWSGSKVAVSFEHCGGTFNAWPCNAMPNDNIRRSDFPL